MFNKRAIVVVILFQRILRVDLLHKLFLVISNLVKWDLYSLYSKLQREATISLES